MWTAGLRRAACLSAFSFQRGASLPEELVQRAAALGYSALAITDECSVSGVVRAHTQAQESGIQLLPGAEFLLPPDADAAPQQVPAGRAAESGTPAAPVRLVVLPHNLQGWGNLCEFITAARRKAAKGTYQVSWAGSDWAALQDCEVLLAPTRAITY
jgi:error-prone DNA polymerase